MKNLINKINFWFNCARGYALPITILNWFVAFVFAINHGGNIILGIIALIGICLVHLATNLIDDYFDYKILIKDERFINSAQNCKCKQLKDNLTNLKEWKNAVIICLLLATVVGIILFFTSGIYVLLFALIGLFIAFIYQKFSLKGLGEIAVIIAYGPALYEGIYYVMTSHFSLSLFILSFATALFTNTVLYVHMLMDFDGDECAHKTTLCRKFKTKENALKFLLFFYITSLFIMLSLTKQNLYYCLTFMTIPLIIDLYVSLYKFNQDKTNLPTAHFWHLPLDNWQETSQTKDAPFYFRFFYSRNIVTDFMILLCIAIILG